MADDRDTKRRKRVAMLLVGGGALGVVGGIFGGNLLAVAFGVGWIIGGGAISSLEQRSLEDEPEATAGEDAAADGKGADAESPPAEREGDR